MSAEARWPSPQPSAPFYGSTALVAALARVPAREVPGLRMVARPQFDLTPETASRNGRPARQPVWCGWGRCWTGTASRAADLAVPAASLNRHVFVSPGVP